MNEFVKVEVDYTAIVNAFELVTNNSWKKHSGNLNCSDWMTMREFRTIGFTTARQTGKLQWLVDFVASKPFGEVVCLFKDDKIQRVATARYNQKTNQQTIIPHVPARMHDWFPTDTTTYERFNVKYVVVDESQFTLPKNRMSFYKWVHEKFGESTLIILVD